MARRAAAAAFACALILVGCSPGATPLIVYVTPPPGAGPGETAVDSVSEPPTESAGPGGSSGPTSSFRTFSDGTWLVGADIKPGTYRTRESSDGCYWERLSGFSGDDTIANELTDYPTIVTIAKSDAGFTSEDCGEWTTDLSQITDSKTQFGPGTYIVGTDMKPGRYRNSGGEGCYWERLKNFSGDGLIANDLLDGRTIVDIKSTDKGFSSEDCGSWTRI